MITLHKLHLEVGKDADLEWRTSTAKHLMHTQRAINWYIGDLALDTFRKGGEALLAQTFEEGSPDHISRCMGVAKAYPPEDRNPDATWSIHSYMASRPDRVAAVAATVEAGQTSDEARRDPPPPQEEPQPARATTETEAVPAVTQVEEAPAEVAAETPVEKPAEKAAWLLAVDVNYFIHTYFHSGSGVESASTFVQWLVRLIQRLKETKGLTDVACCFDSTTNHRKKLTETWEYQYKGNRKKKEPELVGQIIAARTWLEQNNICCVSIDDMEADDIMASYAKQFAGKVTLLSGDKDMRQCLSSTCNILRDVTWEENAETNQSLPVYDWLTAKSHTAETGIRPDQWICKQMLWGDAVDNIKGATKIGDVGATKLVLEFGSAEEAVNAAKRMDSRLLSMKHGLIMADGLLDFEERLETTRQLVALRVDLDVPKTTRI